METRTVACGLLLHHCREGGRERERGRERGGSPPPASLGVVVVRDVRVVVDVRVAFPSCGLSVLGGRRSVVGASGVPWRSSQRSSSLVALACLSLSAYVGRQLTRESKEIHPVRPTVYHSTSKYGLTQAKPSQCGKRNSSVAPSPSASARIPKSPCAEGRPPPWLLQHCTCLPGHGSKMLCRLRK
jgi:hypothetical protein